MRRTTFATAAASMTWLAACAAPMPGAAPATAPAGMRVLVKLTQASADTGAIAAQVTLAAGTQARYLSATSPQWHALVLQCADAQACEAAFQRLSADKAGFEAVQRDERRRILSP
jgi:hypothetical protein